MDDSYKPVVPEWVAEILQRKKQQDPFATLGRSKEWDEWKSRYSRQYKYAMRNGWTVEGQEKTLRQGNRRPSEQRKKSRGIER